MHGTDTLEENGVVPGRAAATATPHDVPATMRAVVQHRYGESDTLEVRTIDVPRPRDNQVLVRVEAAGVDRGVWHLMTGLPYIVRLMGVGFRGPKQAVPGLDLTGQVVAVGSAVSDFRIGDVVFGVGSGTFAEYAVADAAKLALRPVGITALQAVAVPISGLTALQALRDVGQVQSGQRVLILGASGGVGSFAVQLARHFKAHVTGVASTEKLDDIGGLNPVSSLRRALTRTGTLVIVGGENGDKLTGGITRQLHAMLLSPFVSQRLTAFVSTEQAEHVRRLGELLESQQLRAVVERSYRLDEAPAALADLGAGRVRGKAVVQILD